MAQPTVQDYLGSDAVVNPGGSYTFVPGKTPVIFYLEDIGIDDPASLVSPQLGDKIIYATLVKAREATANDTTEASAIEVSAFTSGIPTTRANVLYDSISVDVAIYKQKTTPVTFDPDTIGS